MNADEKYISYCGLYCKECLFLEGEIAELARQLNAKLQAEDFERIARGLSEMLEECKSLKNYEQFVGALKTIGELRCENICREGGGSPKCVIRQCSQQKNVKGCWECEKFEDCEKLKGLKPVNECANLKNLRKIKNEGVESFLKGEKYW